MCLTEVEMFRVLAKLDGVPTFVQILFFQFQANNAIGQIQYFLG
jgi:hypothetical protein